MDFVPEAYRDIRTCTKRCRILILGRSLAHSILLIFSRHGPPGQAVSVARRRTRGGDRASAGPGQQRQEHSAQRAAAARPARGARRPHRRHRAGHLHKSVACRISSQVTTTYPTFPQRIIN